jgi:hypothetical protein
MIRFALSYLAGAVSVAGAVALLNAPELAGAGMIAAAAILAAALWTAHKFTGRRRGRQSRTAVRTLRPAPPARRRAPAPPAPASAPPSAVELDITSALVNFGARKGAAAAAARSAVQNHPGADFDTLFRAALDKSKAAA